jgi:hypothetical protein
MKIVPTASSAAANAATPRRPACGADCKAMSVMAGAPKNPLDEAINMANGALVRRCFSPSEREEYRADDHAGGHHGGGVPGAGTDRKPSDRRKLEPTIRALRGFKICKYVTCPGVKWVAQQTPTNWQVGRWITLRFIAWKLRLILLHKGRALAC